VLQPGHVTTVEPGIYLADWGGVRIEDVGVVEADGFRVLTTSPKHPAFA
jgi:Xaa-Pro aminopeptidase